MTEQRGGRLLVLAGLLALVVLVPVAVAAQPAYDLRQDLVSDLGSRGARLPGVGHAVVLSVALAHLGAALLLRGRRLAAAAISSVIAAGSLVGVVLFPITCPRGAGGCNGPRSGRAHPHPADDVIHRDLVVVLEVASLLMVVLLLVHLVRTGSWACTAVVALALVASPGCLLEQQRGHDIGYWQLSWLVALLTPLAVLALAPEGASGAPSGSAAGVTIQP